MYVDPYDPENNIRNYSVHISRSLGGEWVAVTVLWAVVPLIVWWLI
jgi:hypothetical protein